MSLLQNLTTHIVRPGGPHWQTFINVPIQSGNYLDSQILLRNQLNHQFLKYGILLRDGDKSVGRLALYQNPGLQYQTQQTGMIGNYECIQSTAVAHHLLSEAERACKAAGCSFVLGPMNGSTWDQYRMTIHPERPPFFTEQTQPSYYLEQWESFGFQSIGEYCSAMDSKLNSDHIPTTDMSDLQARGIRIRQIHLDQYEQELEQIYTLCREGFAHNYLYSPISREEFLAKYLPMKSMIAPEWVLLAENENQVPVACIFCLPDYTSTDQRRLVAKTIVRHPDQRWSGIGSVLAKMITTNAKEAGFESVIHAFLLHDGNGKKISAHFHGDIIQTYRLYGKYC